MADFNDVYNLTKNLKVLYIEDDFNFKKETSEIFNDIFSSVTTANNGEEGLNKYKNYFTENKKYFDIVLTDLNMPKKDGLNLIKEIYEINQYQVIIVISAYNTQENLLELVNIGIEQFLTKPLKYDNMLETFIQSANKIIKNNHNDKEKKSSNILLNNDYYFDTKTELLMHNNAIVKLTKKEYELMKLFIKNGSKITLFDEIYSKLWTYEPHIASQESLKPLISRLRKKIPGNTIENIYGLGYKIIF